MTLQITPLLAFTDNYIWVLENAGETWVVDPGDADPVKAWLEKHQRVLDGILITHHHRDHVGGVDALCHPGIRVIGPGQNKLPATTEAVYGGETIQLAGLSLLAIAVPGHTLNHMAYFAAPVGTAPLLFCGDTLFVAGCGRLFEGTPQQMYQSLQTLAHLPDTTQVYCAHEYTLANLRFAQNVEPENSAIPESIATAQALRKHNRPTVPSTLAREKCTNPFLRSHVQEIKDRVALRCGAAIGTDAECFAQLRHWKDQF